MSSRPCPAAKNRAWRSPARSISTPNSSSSTNRPWASPSSETRKTLDFVGNIKKAGKSAIFIDHNIFHVYPVVDRLYVLDRGKVAGVYDKSEISMDELIDRLYRVARSGSME